MKNLIYTFLIVISVSIFSFGQSTEMGLQITEIMYNPPEVNDSLEFIELQNTNSTPLDISGWKVLIGASTTPRVTFPSNTILTPNAVIVLAFNDSSFVTVYGIQPNYKLTGQGLSNSSSLISIVDANNTTITSVTYQSGWHTNTNGNGSSLNRCNFTENINSAESWAATLTPVSTNAIVNNKAVLATPGIVEPCTITSIPVYTIAQIHTENANGSADSVNVNCELRGIVHSDDFRGGVGIEFALIDYTNTGIIVIKNIDLAGFSVNRGDSVHVKGIISQSSGLTLITPNDIQIKSSGNNLVTPMVITSLNEYAEGRLVKLEGLTVQEIINSSTAGFEIVATNGIGTSFIIRIDADIDAFYRTFIPGETFTVTGIGTQLDMTSPYNEGYKLLVRDLNDFDFSLNVQHSLSGTFQLYPNPTQGKVTLTNLPLQSTIKVIDQMGKIILEKISNTSTEELMLLEYSAGIYSIQVESSNQFMQQRIILR